MSFPPGIDAPITSSLGRRTSLGGLWHEVPASPAKHHAIPYRPKVRRSAGVPVGHPPNARFGDALQPGRGKRRVRAYAPHALRRCPVSHDRRDSECRELWIAIGIRCDVLATRAGTAHAARHPGSLGHDRGQEGARSAMRDLMRGNRTRSRAAVHGLTAQVAGIGPRDRRLSLQVRPTHAAALRWGRAPAGEPSRPTVRPMTVDARWQTEAAPDKHTGMR